MFVNTRFVNNFAMLRESLQAAKGSAGSAESCFKGIEQQSADLRRLANNIDTYAARNDNEERDCSESGKAALATLKKISGQQENMEGLHRTEEAARQTSVNELTEASGLARDLKVEPNDKTALLNAINSALQQNQLGSYDYTNIDTTLFTADLELPNAIEHATQISQDAKGLDKSLQGTFLDQRLDKLENTYGQASSHADRAETYQDRVEGEVERALSELSRIERRRIQEFVFNPAPYLAGEQLRTTTYVAQDLSLSALSFAQPASVAMDIKLSDERLKWTFDVVLPED